MSSLIHLRPKFTRTQATVCRMEALQANLLRHSWTTLVHPVMYTMQVLLPCQMVRGKYTATHMGTILMHCECTRQPQIFQVSIAIKISPIPCQQVPLAETARQALLVSKAWRPSALSSTLLSSHPMLVHRTPWPRFSAASTLHMAPSACQPHLKQLGRKVSLHFCLKNLPLTRRGGGGWGGGEIIASRICIMLSAHLILTHSTAESGNVTMRPPVHARDKQSTTQWM